MRLYSALELAKLEETYPLQTNSLSRGWGLSLYQQDGRPRAFSRIYPGLLPYVLEEGDLTIPDFRGYASYLSEIVTYLGELSPELVVPSQGEHSFLRWDIPSRGYTITYGKYDWPEPRILVLGECNPLSHAPAHALLDRPARSSGARFREGLGLSSENYLRKTVRVDIWQTPGKYPRTESDPLIRDLNGTYPRGIVLVLGKKAEQALRPGVWEELPGRATLPLPHPSGRNRTGMDWESAREAIAALEDVYRPKCPVRFFENSS